jgi:hypothetical protein
MRHRIVASFALALGAALLAACAQNLVQVRESADPSRIAFSRVAVVPFRAAPRPGAATLRPDVPALVASYLAESFAAHGIDAVPPSDVVHALGDEGTELPLGTLASAMRDRFGAEALVTGRVHRFRERGGEALGTTQPASVGFDVRIYSTTDGKLLWAGVFDHTQVALSENALTAAQYPGSGTRWLTAEELARWGAGRMVRELPIASTAP